MSALSIQPTYPIFTDIDGQPLEAGYVWIGQANLDPQVNPINVYWDAALTIPAGQPIRTINGYPSRNGTPGRLYVNSDYSIRVQNKNGSVVYSAATATERYSDVVVSGVNAEDVIYDPPFTNAVQTNQEEFNSRTVSVKDFGAVGNSNETPGNGTDDYAAIQAALNYVGSTGGGTVTLAKTNGQYRITQGLKIPSYTTLQGVAPDRYPFNSGNANNSCLFADFVVQNQWVIDTSATKVATGLPYAYNELCNNVAPNFAFNSGVRDLLVRAAGVMPWGGIRIQGCPGAVVDNVSVTGCGTGMLVNFTFGGYFSVHCFTPYYGVIAWDNVNANNWEVYCAATQPVAQIVPAGYLQPMMAALNGAMVPVLKLNTNAHYNRSWGMIICSDGFSTSTNNSLDLTVERYSGGLFQYYSYGTVFNKFYFEGGGTSEMNYACVSAYSLWVTNTFHAYLSSPSCYLVDLGVGNQIRMTAIGLKNGSYGFGPYPDIYSLMTIDGIPPSDFGPAVSQFNMFYTSGSLRGAVSTFQNSWANVGGTYDVVNYILKKQINEVNLTGGVSGGSAGTVAFNLPAGYRPLYRIKNIVPGGEVQIDPNGDVTMVSGTTLYLEQVRFTASP
jgi:hypothetical protein